MRCQIRATRFVVGLIGALLLALSQTGTSAQTIPNPSFETDIFTIIYGYAYYDGGLTGWTYNQYFTIALNPDLGNPFANNGATPDGVKVAFVKTYLGMPGFLTTTITDLTPGVTYAVSFRANSRANSYAPNPSWSLNGGAFANFTASPAVGGLNPYYLVVGTFTASDVTAPLAIKNDTEEDSTVLVDDFHIWRPGRWSASPWTGDTSSGIASGPTAWAYRFGSSASATINGVTLTGVETPAVDNANLRIAGPDARSDDTNTLTALGGAGSSAVAGRSIYNGHPARVTLKGLTPGAAYTVSFLSVGSEPSGRVTLFSSDMEGALVDQDQFGDNKGIRVDHTFTATADTRDITVTQAGVGPWHFYGMALRRQCTVTSTADTGPGSLRQALVDATAVEGLDTIVFAPSLSGQTITLATELPISSDVTMDAHTLPEGITLSGNNVTRVFNISAGTTVAIRSMKIVGGKAPNGTSGGKLDHPEGAGANGGGILNAGSLTLTNCTIISSAAGSGDSGGDGGGIYNSGTLDIAACTLAENVAGGGRTGGNGGGIFSSGPLKLTACTLTRNAAGFSTSGKGGSGGGIFSSGPLSVTASTLSGNLSGPGSPGAAGTGAGIQGGAVTLEYSIIAENTAPDGTQDNLNAASVVYDGANLLGSAAIGTGSGPAPMIAPNAFLAPLGNFGGPTQTMPPLFGSPAIDAASGSTRKNDQRGFPIADDDGDNNVVPDLGAAEALLFQVTSLADHGPGSLRDLIAEVATVPGPNTITFAPSLSDQTITLATELPITSDVTIDASAQPGGMTVSGTNVTRVFNIAAGTKVSMHSLKIVGGRAPNGTSDEKVGRPGGTGENGGGILNAGSLTLNACTLIGNAAGSGSFGGDGGSGGGIFSSGPLNLTACTLADNAAGSGGGGGNGGGIFSSGPLNLSVCTLARNAAGSGSASHGGSGGSIFSSGTLSLTACTLADNAAGSGRGGGNGGGIFSSGPLNLNTCTVARNAAGSGSSGGGGSGGGVFSSGPLSVTACTLSGNLSGRGSPGAAGTGAGIQGGSVTLQYSLIAQNAAADGTQDNLNASSLDYKGVNLLGAAAIGTGSGPAPMIVANPLLSPLGNYGGPTQTMPPLFGSPAIDAASGSSRTNDQRGLFISDGDGNGIAVADLGAAEHQRVLVTSVGDDLDGVLDGLSDGSLREALRRDASGAIPAESIGFAPSLSGQTITLAWELPINSDVTINASTLPGGLTISGNHSSRVFYIAEGNVVSMHSLNIINGKAWEANFYNDRGPGSPGGDGGGIWNAGTLTLTACTFTGNAAGHGSFGVGNFQSGDGGRGGGIFSSGPLSLTACTLVGNAAGVGWVGGDGGGIFSSGPLKLTACTLARNAAAIGYYAGTGAGIRGGVVMLQFSIIAQNNIPGEPQDNVTADSVIYDGVNLLGSAATGTGSGPAPIIAADPRLATLGNYGSPMLTMPPRFGSPAIDAAAGSTRTNDQRGFPIFDGDGDGVAVADLGAAEMQRGTVTSVTTLAATALRPFGATLNGTVSPGDQDVSVWFEWGTTTAYGNVTAVSVLDAAVSTLPMTYTLTGLIEGNTYHCRAVASNIFGVTFGANQSFSPATFSCVPITNLAAADSSFVGWADYDNDGRLDFLLTGYPSQLWRNNGAGFSNVTTPVASGLPDIIYSCVAWGDYDNDGRLDFLITGMDASDSFQCQLWRNTISGFSNLTASAFPSGAPPGVRRSSVAWGDYDNDGRLDFLLTGATNGTSGVSQLWRNTGGGFTNVPLNKLPQVDRSSVAWGDYDNDGRLDFLLTGATNGTSGVSQLWRNTGSGFTNVPIPELPNVTDSSVAWGDYDNDGRLDFLLTGATNGTSGVSQLWRNTGSGFINMTETLALGLPQIYGGSVGWGDYDNDGRLDFLLTGATNGTAGVSQLWRNTGGGFTNVPLNDLPQVARSSVAWGDYDNDGRLDFLLTGSNRGTVISQLWRNNMPVANTPPDAPTGLAMTATTNAVMLSWNSSTDGQTPAAGLSYNVRAGITSGGTDIFAGHVNGVGGFRRVPALGNASLRQSLALNGLTNGKTVYWSVQAVDTSFAGGPFATEISVVTIPSLVITTNIEPSTLSISWTPPTWGWTLQELGDLSTAAWSNSPSGELNPATVPATNGINLYRLFRP